MSTTSFPLLQTINDPADLRRLARADLKQLATELRAFVIESVSQTGGHLSSNLGTVELTVALHHVFNTPEDRLVWDVGHQTYPHKILTGRRDRHMHAGKIVVSVFRVTGVILHFLTDRVGQVRHGVRR